MQVPVSREINAILEGAAAASVRRGHYFVGVEHLFDLGRQQRLFFRLRRGDFPDGHDYVLMPNRPVLAAAFEDVAREVVLLCREAAERDAR